MVRDKLKRFEKCFACGVIMKAGEEVLWAKPELKFWHVGCWEAGEELSELKGVAPGATGGVFEGLRRVLGGGMDEGRVRAIFREEMREFVRDPEGYLR